MNRLTLLEFRDIFNSHFEKIEKNKENLLVFFSQMYYRLPLFPEEHYKKIASPDEYEEWDDWGDTQKTQICEKTWYIGKSYNQVIPIEQIYGDSWVFKNKFLDGRPLPDRLAKLFLAEKPEDIIGAFTTKINENKYYTDDGNHRIYAAYLRGWGVNMFIEGEFTE